MKEFQLCRIKQQYLYDLANVDKNISIKGNRPYLAVFVQIANQDYAIPITSKMRRKNGKLRNSETTINLFGQKGEELGALLFNKMLPITEDKIIQFDIKKDPDYIALNKKIQSIRKIKKDIKTKANAVYNKRISVKEPTKSNMFFDDFCCNYKLLETECHRVQPAKPVQNTQQAKTAHSSFDIMNRAKRAAKMIEARKKAEAAQQLGDNQSVPKKNDQSL